MMMMMMMMMTIGNSSDQFVNKNKTDFDHLFVLCQLGSRVRGVGNDVGSQ